MVYFTSVGGTAVAWLASFELNIKKMLLSLSGLVWLVCVIPKTESREKIWFSYVRRGGIFRRVKQEQRCPRKRVALQFG